MAGLATASICSKHATTGNSAAVSWLKARGIACRESAPPRVTSACLLPLLGAGNQHAGGHTTSLVAAASQTSTSPSSSGLVAATITATPPIFNGLRTAPRCHAHILRQTRAQAARPHPMKLLRQAMLWEVVETIWPRDPAPPCDQPNTPLSLPFAPMPYRR